MTAYDISMTVHCKWVYQETKKNVLLCVTIRKRLCKKIMYLISREINTAKSLEALISADFS